MTFKECVDRYIEENRASWKNEKHADQWFASFNQTKRGNKGIPRRHASDKRSPVSEIDTALCSRCWSRSGPRRQNRQAASEGGSRECLAGRPCGAIAPAKTPPAGAATLRKPLRRAPSRTRSSTTTQSPTRRCRSFMAELRQKAGVSARALELTILTAVRTGEVIGAKWSEFDLQAKLWTIRPRG